MLLIKLIQRVINAKKSFLDRKDTKSLKNEECETEIENKTIH